MQPYRNLYLRRVTNVSLLSPLRQPSPLARKNLECTVAWKEIPHRARNPESSHRYFSVAQLPHLRRREDDVCGAPALFVGLWYGQLTIVHLGPGHACRGLPVPSSTPTATTGDAHA